MDDYLAMPALACFILGSWEPVPDWIWWSLVVWLFMVINCWPASLLLCLMVRVVMPEDLSTLFGLNDIWTSGFSYRWISLGASVCLFVSWYEYSFTIIDWRNGPMK